MAMLAFLPWVTVRGPQSVGSIRMTPWKAGGSSAEVEAILRAYVDPTGAPVSSATILHVDGKSETSDLSGDEREELFGFRDLLAFAGLARRELCGAYGLGYANTHSFSLVIQSFGAGEPGPVAVGSRRRGGRPTAVLTADVFQERMQPHVARLPCHEVDVPLIEALMAAFESPSGSDYAEAIFSFNAANTDSSQVPEQHEVVAMVGAFERLLGVGGNADGLANGLQGLLAPHLPADRMQHLKRLNAFEAVHGAQRSGNRIISKTTAGAWMRDLYRTRNAFGHGRRSNNKKAAWRLADHLLLGAFIFPLALAVRLANDGHYRLSDSDKDNLAAVPKLLGLRDPHRWSPHRGSVWSAVRSSAQWVRWRKEAIAAMGQ